MGRVVWLLLVVACGAAVPPETSSAMHHAELPLGPEPGPNAEMRIHLIDVGQGAATLVEFSCGVVLVDTGGEQNPGFDSEQRVIAYLDRVFRLHKRLNSTIAL